MGISDRKEREKQEMRRLIIEAAMRMFVDEGYEKTSIRAIAEKIEYSPGTIYLYYKDKDELLYEVQREAFGELLKAFQENAVSKDPWKRLTQVMHTYVEFGLTHPDLYDLMFIIRSPMKTADEKGGWTNGDACFDYLNHTIQECIERQLIRYKDNRVASLSVWSLGHGLVSLEVRCRFKVLEVAEGEVARIIKASIDEHLKLMKT
ncbi:TetR/AcrR family transcriptional regulator [Chitinophaga alhagiae]|uniref:TetR/AcrR family transcriptional regulator n=1 Tax=Chitinophaga alhagiae TaxID=2203219 RepID=UPI000E5C2336|nr:TetR/AcrR family transcriptional regulator [Chitinophaga alhagiae]